jgi:hypothetical protein
MITSGPKRLRRVRLAMLVAGLSLAGACSHEHTLHPDDTGAGGAGGVGGAQGTGGYHPDGGNSGIGGDRADGGAGGGDPGSGGVGGSQGIGGATPGIGGQGMGGATFGLGGNPGLGGATPGLGGQGGSYTPCVQEGTQAACDTNAACHSVFFDPHNCSCAGTGCCATFHHCADFGGAQCYGGVGCAVATPYCESPYVVAYSNGCYEGCVIREDCASVCTLGADQSCNDNPIVSAIHGHCTAAGACECGTGFILNPNTGRCL